MTPAELDALLHEWARYVTDPPASRQSLMQSIYTFKMDGAGRKQSKPLTARGKQTQATVAKPVEVNPRAEATETAVAVLRSVAPDLGLVVVAEYLSLVPSVQGAQFRWWHVPYKPVEGATGHVVAKAGALGISASAYRHRLKRAHIWLERYFAVVRKAA